MLRSKGWKREKTNQVLIIEKLMELQEGLIADLDRIQGKGWNQAGTMTDQLVSEAIQRIGDRLDDGPTLYDCHHCQDTGFKTKTDAAGQLWANVCDECETGNRLFEGRKIATLRAQAEKQRKQSRDEAKSELWGSGRAKDLPL